MGSQIDRNTAGIVFILAGVTAISVNDMLIKQLSGGYPLHQMVFIRSSIGILFSLMLVRWEGGFHLLKTRQPSLHLLRGVLIVISNMTFFAALAVIPLADATALFFAAPLMITLLSIPILGEKVGPWRLGAVLVGFLGVVVMMKPWAGQAALGVPRVVLFLPVLAALTYALNQLMTRRLGVTTSASALAVYIQATFITVSVLFYIVAGDGRFAEGVENGSLQFLLRAWVWPAPDDRWLFLGLGLNSAIVSYCLSQAYRMADAATVAPFEYVGLPLAVFWGWAIWAELPDIWVSLGIVLIMGSGLFVFLRESMLKRRIASGRRVHRRY
ncbi:DMT family transporter [Lutimaribacter sp. EGI FJ00015]|uniref:DMT family transporter n=1 Tax=Lutimaribacter degradans TaxID=2945989 RepID=A0ACC5ZXU7_9RHOB|nr:DMT family transporter [Lutimaribacter sp. EGI FJ00013]MCM2563005.1 DMT family transporter [Lutimaribacter sp. EGI FJ00013]MCO0614173.1 DMT family transporter [Lutimaribacter sp. EGI FJ00015]MCO0636150.1 DMT family transporter [Lutimaribacter sp. EGI FJ00014]